MSTRRTRLKVWHRKKRYSIRQQPMLDRAYRIAVGVVGGVMVLAGMAMIPLPIPGPGWVTFFLGLSVLSTEFVWAHRLTSLARRGLHRAREYGAAAVELLRRRVVPAIGAYAQTAAQHLSAQAWVPFAPSYA
ncbi:MAG: PGPGW domain-containing protein [Gordonia sp. (in: high G+C Gram-positive bacteria)]|uniref:PGPGW domain-containing protein n=1 Tax=Gordonia sp. (in: high G+C Gram-positive bacteria) TaxID=84139 RepID=UPI0039E69445